MPASLSHGVLGAVVEGDLVAVGVGEGERATERTVDRSRDDRVAVGREGVVDGLDVGGVEPDRGTDAGLGDGGEIGAGNDVSQRERDRRRLEDDGMRRARLRADEAEVLLVERLRRSRSRAWREMKSGPVTGMMSPSFVSVF